MELDRLAREAAGQDVSSTAPEPARHEELLVAWPQVSSACAHACHYGIAVRIQGWRGRPVAGAERHSGWGCASDWEQHLLDVH
jgi:hypothetical protein